GLHPTGTWGVVGCALAVACASGKKPQDLVQILNIASSFALSPYVKNSFVGKNVAATFAGVTNYLGLLANLFFDSGIRADESSFKMTFSRFVSDDFEPDLLYDNLGKEYAIAENYFKPYPTCRFTHPSLDALKAILEREQVNPEDVARVKVWSFRAAVHTSSSPPSNAEAMRFSTPYLVAVMLVYGNINLGIMNFPAASSGVSIGNHLNRPKGRGIKPLSASGGLKDELIEDHKIKDLAARVEMIHSREYERMLPRHNPARVTVQLKDGREFTHETLNCRGDPLNPLTGEEVSQKFLSLAGPVIGDKRAEQFLEKLKNLESEKHIQELTALLRPA
ncbi:MAG: MmgE/PrpD family protein, partial [Deltaproteobacteria bacterium]|nr:MmgE/PrpD family protein [Deltaproteobacteria bacterium]